MNRSAGCCVTRAGPALSGESLSAMPLGACWYRKLGSQLSCCPGGHVWLFCRQTALQCVPRSGDFLKTVLGCFTFEKSEADLWFSPPALLFQGILILIMAEENKKRGIFHSLAQGWKVVFLVSICKRIVFTPPLLLSSLHLVLNFFGVTTLPLWTYQPSSWHFYWTLEKWNHCSRMMCKILPKG